jgi:hypothetical protein
MDKYGIITEKSTYVEGDERSRTNPGHGYPAHTVTQTVLNTYSDKDTWEHRINRLANPSYGSPEKFTAIIYREVEVEKKVIIKID